jgi:dihydrofolate synthase/folylpolyglutamate synthase
MVYLPHWPIPATLGKRQVDFETVFERMNIVLSRLGNPHQKMAPVIHVAGTNGKGSTSSLLAKIFSCAGYNAHLYTSPHLHHCNERINLNGEKISDNFLYEVMDETRLACTDINLTFMESFTIGAFLAFAKTKADIVILECGMGGRIDATNIVENKLASIITPISYDHTEYLGNNIERIALEKAMIMRPQVPLIVASQSNSAKNIIKILADDQKIDSYFYDDEYMVLMDEDTKEFDYYGDNVFFENLPKPSLAGSHQYINFACAITCALKIKNFNITENAVRQAISSVNWPSRLEKVENNLNKILINLESEIWIDGAHNEGGAYSLATWLKEQNDHKQNFIICGFSRGKCKERFVNKFQNIAQLIAVRVNGEPYAEDPEIICQIAKKFDKEIKGFDDLIDSLQYISQIVDNKACRVIICGSLHLARDVKRYSQMIAQSDFTKKKFNDFDF